MKTQKITKKVVTNLIDVVSQGLCKGKGVQIPGQMCIEAAVCYAYGLPHSDEPPCVGKAVRRYKINLNEANWSSNDARAKGMLEISIAQLNSIKLDQLEFAKKITLKTINTIIADLAVKFLPEIEKELRKVKDLKEVRALCNKLKAAADADADAAAFVASFAADAAAFAAADAAAFAAADADAFAVTAASFAADAAAFAADTAAFAARDKILIQAANNCLEVLKEMKSEGCNFLYLIK